MNWLKALFTWVWVKTQGAGDFKFWVQGTARFGLWYEISWPSISGVPKFDPYPTCFYSQMCKFPAHGTCSLPIPVEGLNVCDMIYISSGSQNRRMDTVPEPNKHGNGRSNKNSDQPPFAGHVELLCSIAGG